MSDTRCHEALMLPCSGRSGSGPGGIKKAKENVRGPVECDVSYLQLLWAT